MFAFRTLLFFISILSTLAVPTPRSSSSLLVHEQTASPPNGFVPNGPASSNTVLSLRIALKQNNIQGLTEALYNVSTPGSSNYGKYLTKAQVEAYVAPSTDTKTAVDTWLGNNGIKSQATSPSGDWLSIDVTVSEANSLLGANFSVYTNEATGENTIRTLSYSLPPSVKDHINLVYPTVNFPVNSQNAGFFINGRNPFRPKKNRPKKELKPPSTPPAINNNTAEASTASNNNTAEAPAACEVNTVSPACLLALYGLPSTVGPQNASQIGVTGLNDEFAQQEDLNLFLKTFRQDLSPNITFSVQSIDGGEDIQSPSDAGLEANVDIQYTAGLAGGVPVTFLSVGTSVDDTQAIIDLNNQLLSQDELPFVLSTSFVFNEFDITPPLAQQICNEYAQLGSRGVSLLFASGDGSVIASLFPTCSDPQDCTLPFVATFPSTCPFVTSVGATQQFAPETAAPFSSGGFSNIFPIPAYQESAVSGFLGQLGNTNAGLFNRTGRGFPDIAAQGVNLVDIVGGLVETASGTSLSAPIVASTIALANALRIQEGKPPLGFLNPLIYSTTDLFTDITSGASTACGCEGFTATTGWDPVTGLGTPIFDKLQALP